MEYGISYTLFMQKKKKKQTNKREQKEILSHLVVLSERK